MHAAAVLESENNSQELVGSPLNTGFQGSGSGLQALSHLVGLLREGEDGGGTRSDLMSRVSGLALTERARV